MMAPVSYRQRGSVYLAVLGAAMIVTVIGLSALALMRSSRHVAAAGTDAADATLYAQCAVDMGMYLISQDPNWRTALGNGVWIDHAAIGSGSYSVEAVDPVDGDMTDSPTDPVVIIGRGYQGQAQQAVQVQLETEPGLGSLEVSMMAGHDLVMDNVTVRSDQTIAATRDTNGKGGAQIYADAEAANNVSGGTYYGATAAKQPARQMPDPSNVLTYYLASGTPISYLSLELAGTNLLNNPGMESGLTDWYAYNDGCTLATSTVKRSGVASIKASGRAAPSAGPAQDLTDKLVSGRTYHVEAYAQRVASIDVPNVRITIRLRSQVLLVPVVTTFSTGAQTVGNQWQKIDGDLTVTWAGSLQKAEVYVETASSLDDFYVDDFVMSEVNPTSDRMIRRVVLSPQSNPYGPTTNAEGIYIIDCLGNRIIIEDCRIAGTLVLVNPKSTSVIQGSVSWEPAVGNYPALLSDKQITIVTGSMGLDEGPMNVNFNPAGSPHPYPGGTTDTDLTDSYPSVITGLVYCKENIVLSNHPTFDGVVMSANDIEVGATELNVTYRPTFLNDPPPGFDAVQRKMQVVRGTWRKLVD